MRRRLPGWARLTLIVVSVSLLVPVAAQAQLLEVKTVPWVPTNPLIPHDTWMGKQVTLKGTANVTTGSWTWDFGDGSGVATGPIDASNGYWLQATHTYTGAPGTVYTARLTVDSGDQNASALYYVAVRAKSLPVEVNVAIDEGLWYLHRSMYRYPVGSTSFGNWTMCTGAAPDCNRATSGYYGVTATNLNAFFVNGHLEGGSPANPYTETVQRAMRQVLAWLTAQAIGLQTNGLGTVNPDVNGNYIGIHVNQTYPYYQGGMFMCAIVASGAPDGIAQTGGPNVLGRKYKDIVQDMVDQYAWAQYDGYPGGGWRYDANEFPDNSTSHWGAIGLIAAEGFGGVSVPQWVKDWNKGWLAYTQEVSGVNRGAFGYTERGYYPWGPYATTASGLLQLAMDSVGRGSNLSTDFSYPAWDYAETFIRDGFHLADAAGTNSYALKNYYYALFTFVKAMLLHDDASTPGRDPVELLVSETSGTLPLDWYAAEKNTSKEGGPNNTDGVARTLVRDQHPAGWWTGHDVTYDQYPFETAWAIMMLSRSAFESGGPVAVATAVPNPAVAGQTITLSGASSFHQDPAKSIVGWKWDLDGDGAFDDGTGVTATVSFAVMGDYTVGLRVEDSAGAFAATTLTVSVAIPPLAPTAEAGGPYAFEIGPGRSMALDGTGSANPDDGLSEDSMPPDRIVSYEWDLDGDGVFDDATGAQPDVADYFTARGAGSYLIQLRVTDNTAESFPSSGQPDLTDTDSAGVVVTVAADTTPPELHLPSGIRAEATSPAGASVAYVATATDDVDGSVTPLCSPASGETFPLGLTSVACSATDSAGNSATGSFDVVVVDTTPPLLVAPPDVVVEATGPLTPVDLGMPTVSDLVDPSPLVSPSSAGPFAPGVHTITWTATDDSGNAAVADQHVTVKDTTPPVVTAPPDILATVTGPLTPVDLGVATAIDLVDGNLVPVPSDPGPFAPGTHTVTWTATDSHGNTGTAHQQVILRYAVGAFLPPVQPLPATNTAKAGSVVPVKWQISDGHGGFIRDLSVVSAILFAETACDAFGYETPIGAATAGGSGLHLAGDQYVYIWKTDRALAGRCVVFILRLADGTEQLARFSFR